MAELSEKLKEKAKIELNETDEIRDDCILQLQKTSAVVETAKQFDGSTDGAFMLKFLRARKFDVQKAADLYVNYYEKRSLLCGVARLQEGNHFNIEMKALAEKYGGFIAVLDELDAHGRKVIICKENVFSTSATADENRPYTLWFFILLEWLLEVNAEMQVNGVVVLSDMSSFSYSHLQWLMTHPSALKERITSIQDAVPMRIKAIRVANEPYVFTLVYALVSPFLKAKLRERLKTISSKYDEIYKLFAQSKDQCKSFLPGTLGGKARWEAMTKKTADDVVAFYANKGSLF